MQGGDPKICRELGLGVTGGGRVNKVGEAEPLAQRLRDAGYECATLHVGSGFESDREMMLVVRDIVAASEKVNFPLYVETHRATITQDIYRTVRFIHNCPGVRLNGDFSHWYTGLEMVYGNWEQKLAFMAPAFERVRFIHGRIGNPGSMQVDIGDGSETGRPFVGHFKELWTRSFMGFLRSAKPGDYLCFAPELLHSANYYARLFPGPDGTPREEGDRYQQALVYAAIARACFAEAQRRLA